MLDPRDELKTMTEWERQREYYIQVITQKIKQEPAAANQRATAVEAEPLDELRIKQDIKDHSDVAFRHWPVYNGTHKVVLYTEKRSKSKPVDEVVGKARYRNFMIRDDLTRLPCLDWNVEHLLPQDAGPSAQVMRSSSIIESIEHDHGLSVA